MMKKAIICLDKVTNEEPEDALTIFGRYIASEIREITYPHIQRWAKLQIQQIIFTAQNFDHQQSHDLPLNTSIFQPRMDEQYIGRYGSQLTAPPTRPSYSNSSSH